MLNRLLTALLTIVAIAGSAPAASAQYMYLDANGNGVHDTGDHLNANGTATTVDLYVQTNQNRDGSPATCDTGDGPLTINVYWIDLMAVGGTVAYSGFVNHQPTMTTGFGELNPDNVRYKNGFGGATQLAPGQYRCCTLTITGLTGSPRIDIVDLVSGSLDFTGFGTQCSGHAFDNVYRLDGPNVPPATGDVGDFTDWDGLAGGELNPPVVTNPGNKTTNELVNLAFTVTATDADLPPQTITWSLTLGTPAATGATIGASTGAFSWTPTEAQGPGVYPVTVTATDNGSPTLSGNAGFTVQVIEVNSAPVLAAIGNKTGAVGTPVTFTATATDADVPANTLTFSLDPGAPPGATINPSTGAFSWTPTACGQSVTVTIRVTDNGAPPLSDFEAITISTGCSNNPPVLVAIGNKTTNELATLAFTATATDPDAGQTLTFSLDAGAPAGATIGASTGAFSWTPTEAQGPGVFPVTVRVTDSGGGGPTQSDFEGIQITVNEVNSAPVLAPIGDKCGAVGTPVTFTATATDTDIPANTLTFSLTLGTPPASGATINPSTGAFSWTPSSSGTFPVTIVVTDNGTPALNDLEGITLALCDCTNNPPVLAAIGNKTVNELTTLAFTAAATDPDAGQTLTFSLDAGAPAGVTIGASTGAFSWTPTEAQGPGVYPITVRVTDSAGSVVCPPGSDFETIQVTVNDVNTPPVVTSPGNKTIIATSILAFTVTATDADVPANTITWSLTLGTPPATGATINGSTGAFSWAPTQAQANQTYPVTIRATDNGTPPLSGTAAITITVLHADSAPVVANPGNKTTNELANLAFTVTATDSDVPPQTITWSLTLGTPAATGATIGAGTGAFSWTPTEAQGPGIYPVTVTATDNGIPVLSGSVAFTITVNEVNSPPILAAIGNKVACGPGQALTFTATATDADIPANTLTFSLDAGAPPGATINAATGVFSWTPTTFGTFTVTVRVTDNGSPALSDFEAFTITVSGMPAPVLGTIGNRTTNELAALTFMAAAAGGTPPYTFSLDAVAPAGATITAAGAFSWTPTEAQGPGMYPITVRVTDSAACQATDSEAIMVEVNEVNSAPLVTYPGNRTVDVGSTLAFTVTAVDSDVPANTITWSLTLGTPAATGATINSSTGVFSWTPTDVQANQVYPLTITATDNGTPVLSGSAAITITVFNVNQAPVLAPIGSKTVNVATLLAFTATATDADIPADNLTFSLDPGAPAGTTMNGSTGVFMWIPASAGIFSITVRVTDNGFPPLSDFETITVLVIRVDPPPTADAGGPYFGIVSSPVSFDGTGSFDPNGDALTYAWDFGDGNTAVGATPMHVYTAEGVYNVTLRVTDPAGNYDEDITTVTIRDGGPVARLVLKNGKSTLNLGDKDILKVGIEEFELPYTAVLVGTVRLSTDFPNAGTVAECAADPKHTRIADLDRNGVPDLEVRFPIACVRNLFRNTPNNSTVNLILTGEFQTATGTIPFRGVMVVTIKTGGGGAPVLAYPNPFNPQGRISFVTGGPGSASIQLFDLQGRLVRTLLPQQYLGAGVHEVAIDGRNDQGVRLSSGVYFYRVMTADGVTEGSISVLK